MIPTDDALKKIETFLRRPNSIQYLQNEFSTVNIEIIISTVIKSLAIVLKNNFIDQRIGMQQCLSHEQGPRVRALRSVRESHERRVVPRLRRARHPRLHHDGRQRQPRSRRLQHGLADGEREHAQGL